MFSVFQIPAHPALVKQHKWLTRAITAIVSLLIVGAVIQFVFFMTLTRP